MDIFEKVAELDALLKETKDPVERAKIKEDMAMCILESKEKCFIRRENEDLKTKLAILENTDAR